MSHHPWALAAFSMLLVLATTSACTAPDPGAGGYTYDRQDAAVRVDTPALRKQKAAAGIEDCPTTSTGARRAGHDLPAITLPCLGGGRDVDLAGLRGTPTVLNFWAQTCGSCRAESPLFQQLHEAAGNDVRVIGVDFYDPLPSRALDFAAELGLTYPQLADPEAVTRAPLHISGLPATVLVDAGGSITHVEYGAVRSAADLAALVRDHLDVDVGSRMADR